MVGRLDPNLQRALVQVGRRSGEPVRINEGFRTRFRQEELAAGRGGATGPAAAPGTSEHEFGRAADVDLTAEQRALLDQVGLTTPVAGEPWHVELADGGGGVGALPGSSLGGGFAGTPAPSAPARPSSLRDLFTGLGSGGVGPAPSALAARAPLPRTRSEDEEEDEETLVERLRRLGVIP